MEVVEEGRGPKVQESQGLWVQRSKGPEDQDISNSNLNTSLTLKKVHLVFSLEIKSKTMTLIYYEWLNNMSDFKVETKMFCNQKLNKIWLSSYLNMIYLSVRIRLTSCIHHTFPFKQFFKWLNTYCFLLQQHRAKLTGQEWTIGDVSSADLRGEIIEIVNFDLLSLEQQRSPCK